jgi:hypothetical protein
VPRLSSLRVDTTFFLIGISQEWQQWFSVVSAVCYHVFTELLTRRQFLGTATCIITAGDFGICVKKGMTAPQGLLPLV